MDNPLYEGPARKGNEEQKGFEAVVLVPLLRPPAAARRDRQTDH